MTASAVRLSDSAADFKKPPYIVSRRNNVRCGQCPVRDYCRYAFQSNRKDECPLKKVLNWRRVGLG